MLDQRQVPAEQHRPAVTNPRISDLTRVDTTRSTTHTHLAYEAAAMTTVVAAASPCPLTKLTTYQSPNRRSMARNGIGSQLGRYRASYPAS